jgi:hypothetical protein
MIKRTTARIDGITHVVTVDDDHANVANTACGFHALRERPSYVPTIPVVDEENAGTDIDCMACAVGVRVLGWDRSR